MFICLANYEKPLFNWLNKLWSMNFDQSAGSSHGVKFAVSTDAQSTAFKNKQTCHPSDQN